MKKLLFIICLFILPICVSAKEYSISELDLDFDIPESYLVITRDNYKNNPEMEKLGITPEYMENVFYKNNIYLDALDSKTGKEVFIIVNPVNADYSNYTKKELESLIPSFESHYESLGGKNIVVDVVTVNGLNYFMIEYSQSSYYILNYYLVLDNNGYNFQVQSKKQLTQTDRNEHQKFMESISLKDVVEGDVSTTVEDNKDSMFIIIGASVGVLVAVIIGIVVSSNKKRVGA